jgi:multidrug efflux pump subunit AcrA (membrane-fusion protein)
MDTKKKKSRVWIWIVGVIVVLIVAALVLIRNAISNASQTVYASYTLASGSLETTITGSGKLESADSQTLQLPAGVTVSDVLVEAGDAVKAGDTLALLDPASLAKPRGGSLQRAFLAGSPDRFPLDHRLGHRARSRQN